jgi:hypothetical protein
MSFVQIQRKQTLNPNTSRNKKMLEHQKGPPNTLPRQAKTILMKWNKKPPHLVWRKELYSRMAGFAMSHQISRRYELRGLSGGIQRQSFRKKAFTSTVKIHIANASTCTNRVGPIRGFHSSLSQYAGVNCPRDLFTCNFSQSTHILNGWMGSIKSSN